MRWVMALGWMLVAGLARAEVPMDLDSPFEKVALIQGRTGEMEERSASKAKAVGDKIEFIMTGGGVALFSRSDVVAVLPRFPGSGVIYDLKDVDGAIQLLEALPENLKQRPEGKPEMLQKWKDLRKATEEAETKRKEEETKREAERIKQDERQVVEWLKEATDFQKARSEAEISEIREKGQRFLELKVGDERKVREGMALLGQVVGKEKGGPLPELSKLNEIQPRTTPDDLMVWVAVGVITASFIGLLVGVSYVSSGLMRFKESAILGGVVFSGIGLAVLGALAAIWWPVEGQGMPMELVVSPKMDKVVILSKNTVKPVYFLPSMEFHVTAQEFANGLLGSMEPSEKATGMFKGRLKAGTLWVSKDRWTWKQPITVLGIPLPVAFVFEGKIPSITSWQEISADKVRLGKIVMPSPLAEIFAEAMKGTLQNGLNAGGFSRLQARGGDGDEILVTTPSSGAKPEVVVKATATSTYRKEITAEYLAKVFMDEKGKEFSGKFITIDGVVEKVSSGSEISGGAVATAGGGLGQNQGSRTMGKETFDIFYLRGANAHGFRNDPLLIKCLIKSAQVFVMDSYGDIYTGPKADVLKDMPLIKKGYRVKFLKEGRVESERIQNNEIEVYGIELSGEGDIQVYDPNQPPKN